MSHYDDLREEDYERTLQNNMKRYLNPLKEITHLGKPFKLVSHYRHNDQEVTINDTSFNLYVNYEYNQAVIVQTYPSLPNGKRILHELLSTVCKEYNKVTGVKPKLRVKPVH